MSETSFINEINPLENVKNLPAKEKLDLDLPNFQSTKYNSKKWKFSHWIFYESFTVCFLLSPLFQLLKKQNDIIYIVGSGSYLISAIIEWTHYKRGCLFQSNLNSACKSNIDQSCRAKFLRMRIGLTYFFCIVGGVILSVGSILHFLLNSNKWTSDQFLITAMIIFIFITISKIDKVVSPTKQYSFLNDLSNTICHYFFFLGSLLNFLGTIISFFPLANLTYFYSRHLDFYIQGLGGVFYIMSGFLMFYRYFLSGLDDLNMDNVSVFSY